MSLPDGQYEYVSPASIEIFGYTPDVFYNSPTLIKDILHPDWRGYFAEEWEKLLAGEMPPTYEYQIICKSGHTKWLSQRNVLVRGKNNQPIAIEGIVTDITNRKHIEEQLRQALAEKTALLQEIHHRVKNNLQAVSSLLYLQADKTEHVETRKILQESRNRVLSMALVHEQLYASENLANIDMARYLKELATNLYHSYHVDIERIRLNVDIEPLMLSIEQAVPCGLLIQELVSNAIKHAFPNEESGTIFIRLHKQEKQLRLVVRNTGVPFPPEIDIERAETMGLDLINTFVQQLQGTLELEKDNGTRFIVVFPKPLAMNNEYIEN
jgi:PAS domain S-box-containing protein